MDNLVAICRCVDFVKLVADVDGMETAPPIFLEIFDVIQVGWGIFELGRHFGVQDISINKAAEVMSRL